MSARPREVDWAIRLLWIMLAIALLASPLRWRLTTGVHGALGILVNDLFFFGIPALLIWKISEGANWARITFLVLVLFGIAVTTAFAIRGGLSHFHVPVSIWVTSGLETLCQWSACVLLFSQPARYWFKDPPRVIRLAEDQR
jgi:hypothetical protein